MDFYFFNTDVSCLSGKSRTDVLIKKGIAATSGERSYGEQLGKLAERDTLLMYENNRGIVAVGTVLETWDGKTNKKPLYYPPSDRGGFDHEYRIKVKWFLDLSDAPITLGELREHIHSPLFTPRGAVSQKIVKWRTEIEELIAERRPSWRPTREAADLGSPAPGRVETTTYRILRDTELARQVKLLHKFRCQICGHTILLPGGRYYAEAHHIRPLGKPHDGPDLIGNILCLCPNHHAELDYGVATIELSALRHTKGHAIDPVYVKYHNQIIYGS